MSMRRSREGTANWLALNVRISGDIGQSGSLSPSCHANTAVEAHQIASLWCDNVYEDITLISDGLKSDGVVDDFIISGDFLGDLYVPGDLREVTVSGDFGQSGTLACIEVGDDIEQLSATNIYASIDAADNVETVRVFGTSSLGTVEATDAIFDGTLECNTLSGGDGIRVWGDLDANVTIRDELASTTRIAVGRDLNGAITFDESDGLKGLITIDWMDSGFGDWSGDVTIGAQTLTPSSGDYDETDVGGGAVGLVPYGGHLFECNPAYTGAGPGSIDVTGTETESITIVHYGSIAYSGEGKPFLVYEAPGTHCTSGCSAELFSNKTSEWDATSIGGGTGVSLRSMVLQGTVREGQHYHVDVNGTLECRDVFGEPGTATKPYWYIFNTN